MTDFIGGNRIELLRNGAEYFPALLREIDAARREIHLQTYIYEDDATGRAFAEALARAAARGVQVCLLLDGFGCKDTSKSMLREMQSAGIAILLYRPKISPWTLKRNRLRRLHRKIAVIDGRVAFVGGINIIDDMNTPGHTPPRVDYAVRVEGPVVNPIHINAHSLWRRTAWSHLTRAQPARPVHGLPDAGKVWLAYVIRDNVLHRNDIEHAYLGAIESAHREIIIANAYFLPGRKFRHALCSAARRGVRVVVLLQARVEYFLLDYASRALYDEFLEAGIEVWEYHTSFMHSKVAVIDGQWATVGSSNIDPISLWLAQEANIVADDRAFAGLLRSDLESALREDARRVHHTEWRQAGKVRKLLAMLTYNLIRLAVGLLGSPDKA